MYYYSPIVETQEREIEDLLLKVERLKVAQEILLTETIPEDTWQMTMYVFIVKQLILFEKFTVTCLPLRTVLL